jgi:hypothetical protein
VAERVRRYDATITDRTKTKTKSKSKQLDVVIPKAEAPKVEVTYPVKARSNYVAKLLQYPRYDAWLDHLEALKVVYRRRGIP